MAFLNVDIVFVPGVLADENPSRLVFEGGRSFWTLVSFVMQMLMIIVGGHVVASTPVVRSTIHSNLPAYRVALAWITLFSMLTSLTSLGV